MAKNEAQARPWLHYADQDRRIFDEEIAPYLPERLLDAHTHLLFPHWHPGLEKQLPLATKPGLDQIDLPALEAWWRFLFPGRHIIGMLMGFPTKGCDWRAENERVAAEARQAKLPFSLLTHPENTEADLEEEVERLRPVGLKPYMCHVPFTPENNARITDLIPAPQLAVAHRHRLSITLHVAKPQGMADPENIADLLRLAEAWPGARFILAHCGRCFLQRNMERVFEALPELPNVYFDTSAVCDLGVFLLLFHEWDRRRILFGTDLVTAAAFRGAYLGLGETWHTCTQEMLGEAAKPTFVAYENLRRLLAAARFCQLSTQELNAIFFENAAALWELDASPVKEGKDVD